jgi:hypothetical protein
MVRFADAVRDTSERATSLDAIRLFGSCERGELAGFLRPRDL